MNDMGILPLVLLGLKRQQRADFLERIVPAMMPASGSQQLTLTALMVDQQVRRDARVDEQLIGEAVQAAGFTKAEDLAPFPTLQRKFDGLSDTAKAKVFPPPPSKPTADATGASRKS